MLNGLGRRIAGIRISRMEISLLLILFTFGITMIVMTPIGGGYDEEQHVLRVWQLSAREMLPQTMSARQAQYPEIYFDLSYRRQPLVEPVGFDYWEQYGGLELYDRGYHYGPIDPRSRYSPPLLLPQAVAMYLGRRQEWTALSVYYLTRFAGLFAYSILAWLAVRFVPFGKWTLSCLAIAPMAIYQASTVNADSITNGIGLLFISGTLYVASREQIRSKEIAILVFLFMLLFLTKPNIYPLALLPFLLIGPSKFSNRLSYLAVILSAVLLFAVEFIGWNMLSLNRGFIPSGGVNAAEQARYILTNPLAFPGVVWTDLTTMGALYLRQWVGVYGYDYGTVPVLTYGFFVLGLASTLFIRTDEQTPDRRTRIGLIVVLVACYLFTALSLYITYTTVGEKFVYGVQGRYFIPIFPLLFLALYNLPALQRFDSSLWVAWTFSLAALLLFTTGLVLTYHVVCGASYYTSGLCYQPFYKNFAPLMRSSPPLSEDTTLVQEIVPVCNGMTQVQVRVNSPGSDPNGSIDFTLRDAQDSVIARETIRSTSLPTDDWYSIGFDPHWSSAGQHYTLTIRGVTDTSTGGPLVAYSLRPEYPLGVLVENGIPLEEDVVFRYGCIAGLEKMWWNVKDQN